MADQPMQGGMGTTGQRWFWRGIALLVLLFAGSVAALVGVAGAPGRRAAAELAAAERRWDAVRPQHYLIEARVITLHGGQRLLLEVRDERLVAGWRGNGTMPLTADELIEAGTFFPVARLFNLSRSALGQPEGWRERAARMVPPLERWLLTCPLRSLPPPVYDSAMGYPRRLFVGLSSCHFQRDGVELRVEGIRMMK